MKYLKNLMLLLLFTTLFAGCKQDEMEFKTQGELLGEQIMEAVDQNNITLCSVYKFVDGKKEGLHNIEEFEIDNGVLIVNNYGYNLEYLLSWYYYKGEDGKMLIDFHFPLNVTYYNGI